MYVCDVLLGKADERIIRNSHDQLSVFGIGKTENANTWRGLFRQLTAAGYLTGDTEGHGTLALTDLARPLLRGESQFRMRAILPVAAKAPKSRRGGSAVPENTPQGALFAALRVLRSRLSQEAKVPPYVICHDRTLAELAQKRPATLNDLKNITGLGASKISRYGQAFLETLGLHRVEAEVAPAVALASRAPAEELDVRGANGLSRTVNTTLALRADGLSASDIAAKRALEVSTIYAHFAESIEAGHIEARDCFDLEEEQLDEILAAFEANETLDTGKLAPAHAALGGRYDYGILKCLLAELG